MKAEELNFRALARIATVTTNGLEVGRPAYYCGTMTPNHRCMVVAIGGQATIPDGGAYAAVEVEWADGTRQWWSSADLSPQPVG
jgi:hypothetical protein